ncbi:protein-methionine-sulfoxide reductase heme-binding subunit MsrQ [Leptothrix discophora]|uniref:sulfite oxidase heme-binding subunit YedZ n=1 Tax=Leptothrix discophora TaxID=89 RepID=UPI002737D64E|nr:protein-methionine-sulfoxide reductase heme-binding subunit MsrQ [Leptothrix discophora]
MDRAVAVSRPEAGSRVRHDPPAVRGAWLLRPWVKPLVLLIALLPLAGWIWGIAADRLGPNPAEALLRGTGLWTLRLLIVTLAITPLRLWTKLPALARWRRMLGLTAFGYALLHFLSYAWLDMGFDAAAIVRDLDKRPFALVGFAAFVGLLPLALTSFNRAIRALGAARWQALHQLVWPVIGLGLLHFLWMRAAKHRYDEVSVYAAIVVVLIAARLAKGSTVAWFKARRRP